MGRGGAGAGHTLKRDMGQAPGSGEPPVNTDFILVLLRVRGCLLPRFSGLRDKSWTQAVDRAINYP